MFSVVEGGGIIRSSIRTQTFDLATKFGGIGEFSYLSTVVILALQVWDLSRQLYQLEVPSRVLSRVNRYLASWNELDFGSRIAMIVSRVGRLIYHWAPVNVRRLASYLLKGSRPQIRGSRSGITSLCLSYPRRNLSVRGALPSVSH